MKKITLIILLLINLSVFSQVKIGNNPSQINVHSLLELESSSKVFVLNKMTTSQMNAVLPLDGAMVFNTDDKCIFIFEGTSWKSLCNSGSDNQVISFDNTSNILTLENGGAVDLSAYVNDDTNELQDISTNATAGNISLSNGSTLTLNVDDADADATNEIQTLSLSGNDVTLSNGGGTITLPSGTVTNLVQNTGSGVITYTNENNTDQTANVVSTDANNGISVGTDGGAYYRPMVRAMGKVNADGTAAKIMGATVSKINTGDYRVTFTNAMPNANYIIQLTVRDFNGTANDDPGIQYINQTNTRFDVHIQNNDDGGSNGSDTDFEFMFTVLDF